MSQTPDYMALTHAHAEATFARVAAGQVNGYDAMAVLIADTLGLSAEDYVPSEQAEALLVAATTWASNRFRSLQAEGVLRRDRIPDDPGEVTE